MIDMLKTAGVGEGVRRELGVGGVEVKDDLDLGVQRKGLHLAEVAVLAVETVLRLSISERGRHHCQVLQEEAACVHKDALPFRVGLAVHDFRNAQDGIGDAALHRAGDRHIFIRPEVEVFVQELHVLANAFENEGEAVVHKAGNQGRCVEEITVCRLTGNGA